MKSECNPTNLWNGGAWIVREGVSRVPLGRVDEFEWIDVV